MASTVVITGSGKDRVGIVAELTSFLFDSGCNLLDSSMTLLRNEFALILMATLPEQMSVSELSNKLTELKEKLQLNLSVRELQCDELAESDDSLFQFMISVYGADRPGIVSGITRSLQKLGLNITDVQTKKVSRADQELFVMMLEVGTKADCSAGTIRDALQRENLGLELDLSVRAIEIMEL